MAEFIEHGQWIYEVEYRLAFGYIHPHGHPGTGFSFLCDEHGQIIEIGPYARYNLHLAISNFIDGKMTMGIETYEYRHRQPSVIRCECGATVELWDVDCNDCDQCGRMFNGSGQQVNGSWASMPEWYDQEAIDTERMESVMYGGTSW